MRAGAEVPWGRLRKLRREAAGAQVAPEVLAEQNLDIRLIVNHENAQREVTIFSRGSSEGRADDFDRRAINVPSRAVGPFIKKHSTRDSGLSV
jgi:hypothetical protein